MSKIFKKFPCLKDDILTLKKLTIDDCNALDELKQDTDVYKYEPSFLSERLVSSKEFITKTCDELFTLKENIFLGIYLNNNPNQLIGLAELYDFVESRNKISIGLRFIKRVWNHGYGTRTVKLLKDYCLNDSGIIRLTAHIMEANIGSQKAFIKNGFVRRRDVHDEDWGLGQPVRAYKYVIYPDGE